MGCAFKNISSAIKVSERGIEEIGGFQNYPPDTSQTRNSLTKTSDIIVDYHSLNGHLEIYPLKSIL